MKGLPILLLPKAYALRDSLLLDVKEWQAIARAGFNEHDIDEDGDSDPWWGSKSIRECQKFLGNVDNWDHDSVASSDFGLLWGTNINIHTAAIWTIIEIFRDKDLLSRVRAELSAAGIDGIITDHDIDKLLKFPLLQSVYAEVLRLRADIQSVFCSEREDIRINEWRFPKRSLLLVPTGPAHRDEDFWNTRDGERRLNKFWADRFFVYANDPRSGPRKKIVAQMDKATVYTSTNTAATNSPKFVSSGLSNSFMPHGVGERVCPGRFFARREIIAFCA
ncbi:hypothetical protein OEA41_006876 [Lepraria neglecta]|uniref:Cytochrome P450 n=1 Tax=Lepraria neglecta TaxID=209136 RepID=A0AAE0DKZ8_9LECA|nr:hypothetical protein OEA41_006876 [Lepraria neglecta]